MKAILKVLLVIGTVSLLIAVGLYLFTSTQVAEAPSIEDSTTQSDNYAQGNGDMYGGVDEEYSTTEEVSESATPSDESDAFTACPASFKGQDSCTMEYAPVCGLMNVQCVKAPCDPVPETFSNVCMACSRDNVSLYTEGECLLEVS